MSQVQHKLSLRWVLLPGTVDSGDSNLPASDPRNRADFHPPDLNPGSGKNAGLL